MQPGTEEPAQPAQPRPRAAFFTSFGLGAAIWALSPLIAGRKEPWDANGPYYFAALAIAGAVAAYFVPRHLKFHYLGVILGQATYGLIALGVGSLFVLGLIVLAVFGLVFLASAALTLRIRRGAADRSTAS
jgi:hypothetical protein